MATFDNDTQALESKHGYLQTIVDYSFESLQMGDDLPEGAQWFTQGRSNQDRYDGPWMHASEYIPDSWYEEMTRKPGRYYLIYHLDETDNRWAIVYTK